MKTILQIGKFLFKNKELFLLMAEYIKPKTKKLKQLEKRVFELENEIQKLKRLI